METSNNSLPQKPLFIGGLVVTVLIIIIGVNFVFRKPAEAPTTDTSVQPETSSNVNKETADVDTIPAYTGRPITEVRPGAGFSVSESVIRGKSNDLNLLAGALALNPENIDDWMAVGTIKKFFNDYEGARDAWEYITLISPNHAQAYANLGNVYGFYLGDNKKAEAYYKKAIASSLVEATYYLDLAAFYSDVIKDEQRAIETIEEGLKNIPNDENLKLLLEALKTG